VEIEVLKTSGDVLIFEGASGGYPLGRAGAVEQHGPRRITAQVRDGDVEVQVEIAYVKAEGRYVVQSVRGANLTSEVLHSMRPPEIVREAVLGVLFGEDRVKTDPVVGAILAQVWARLRGEPDSLDDVADNKKLPLVAVVYKFAYMVGQRPTATVAQGFDLPRSTAGRLIRQARDQGLLGPTTERKAGV
jgi:hypothetical protein